MVFNIFDKHFSANGLVDFGGDLRHSAAKSGDRRMTWQVAD
jgi:hypothetical protein